MELLNMFTNPTTAEPLSQGESITEAYWMRLLTEIADATQRPIMFGFFCTQYSKWGESSQASLNKLIETESTQNAITAILAWTEKYSEKYFENISAGQGEPPPKAATVSCNTVVPFRHLENKPSQKSTEVASRGVPDSFGGVLETGGFDTVHAGYSGQWDRDKFKRFAEQADELQELALKGAEHLAVMHLDSGDTWNFKAFGRNEGCNYRWCCDWMGNDLLIMNRAEACESFPHFRLQMKSVPLMNNGPYRLHRYMVEHLTDLGFKFTEELLGRVDGCVDMPGQDVREFVRLLVDDHQVTKLKEGAIYFSNNFSASTGLAVGSKASCEIGIYDKLKDLEKKGDLVKQDMLVQRRWGGVLPEHATRIEFRTGRKLLAKSGINTVAQLKTWGWPIMEYFGNKVFRLNANPVARESRHSDRDEVHPLWAKVMAMFEAWARRVDEPVPVMVKRSAVQPQADRLSAIGKGCLESMFAKEGRHFETDDDYIQAVAEHAAQNAHESRLTVDLRREQMNRKTGGVLMPREATPF